FTATGPTLVDHPPAIVQSSSNPRAGIIFAPARPSRTFEKDATIPIIAPALALQMASIVAPIAELSNTFSCFRHTSLAIIDHYAGLFEYRVFKHQYLIEFLLPTGERCRECKRFARRIVDNMNDSPTRLIGMRPNDAMKLERVDIER
ncbi:10873_t:CDS:2, partial [Funneliformis geosporum]